MEDFIKAIDRKSQAVNSKLQGTGLKIITIRVNAIKQSFIPTDKEVACVFEISINVQHDG